MEARGPDRLEAIRTMKNIFSLRSQRNVILSGWLFGLVGSVFIGGAVAQAQTFVDPGGLPPGGRSATYLDTSATLQQKLGSLIVTEPLSPPSLCLNAPASGPTSSHCVSAWTGVTGALGGPFVRLRTESFAAPQNVANYENVRQRGAVRFQANGASPIPTFVTRGNSLAPNAVALYGTNREDWTSYAGYFSGRVLIDRHVDLSGGQGQSGKLCLNGTSTYNPSGPTPRYGCITQWTDIQGGPITAYVKLQTSNVVVLQNENNKVSLWLKRALQLGSAVVGAPSTTQNIGFYCGDGLCSVSPDESSTGPNYCITDCAVAVPPPGDGSSSTTGEDEIVPLQ